MSGTASKESEFNLSNAISLLTQQVGIVNTLWGIFAAATFTAAAYGISVQNLSSARVAAVTLGFVAFALGHGSLIKQALTISLALRSDIGAAIRREPNALYKASLDAVVGASNPLWASRMFHLIIDGCVIAALWSAQLVRAFGWLLKLLQ